VDQLLVDDPFVMLRDAAIEIVRRLRKAGYEAVFAGGCVRDRILGIDPADYDIATSARPEEVEALFENTVAVGRKFGIIVVPAHGHDFEVATFRHDGPYLDGRHPSSVTFTTAEEDALRRDFTINAMFEDPIEGRVLDYTGGRNDLGARLVRAVGDPRRRFAEDRLRMVRAVRFAARLGFEIEAGTMAAIAEEASSIVEVSAERLGDEVAKILTEGRARRAFELLDASGLLAMVLPEMLAMKGCEQSPDYHPEGDVFVHTLACIDRLPAGCPLTLALGVLLHDVAKPPCAVVREGRPTFYGHCDLGARMAEDVCRRLRYSNATTERVSFLVAQHLRHTSAPDMRTSTLKRFLRQDGIDELLELTRIDALASNGDLGHYEFCTRSLAELPETEIRPPRLVTGHDLIALGLTPGPAFKTILGQVEDAQLDGSVTSREEALALVERLAPNRSRT
jgi:poly(A) polymerase